MSKSKKLTNRIIAVILIVLGLILGGTWNSAKYCIGDKIFIALGISPWSNGSSGTHYPAIIGSFVILAGISILNLTLPIVLFQIKRLKTCKNRKESLFF